MDEDFDDGYSPSAGSGETSADTGTAEPVEDSTSETDVRRALTRQKQAKGITTNRDEEPIERDPNDRNVNRDDVREALRESNERQQHKAVIDTVGTQFQGLAPYAEQALQNGTTIENAVKSWHSAEQAVHRDPPNGLTEVLQQMGYDPGKVLEAAYLGMKDPATINRNIAAMASDTRNYPHFQQLRGTMAQLVQAGHAHTLAAAYKLALAARANASRASSPASSRRAANRGIH